jgi:hypothetical protein
MEKQPDSIRIYAAQSQDTWLRQFIAEKVPYVSAVSYVEVLGYYALDAVERDCIVGIDSFTEVYTPKARHPH